MVAIERKGQVVNEPVAACSCLPIPLQSKYVPILVVTGHFLGETVSVTADVRTFAIDRIQHTVQPVVSELVAAERRLISGFPGHAADVAVVAGGAVPGVVIQVLRELIAADGCQPAAEVVVVGAGIQAVSEGFLLHPSVAVVAQAVEGTACAAIECTVHGHQPVVGIVHVEILAGEGTGVQRTARVGVEVLRHLPGETVGIAVPVVAAFQVRPCLLHGSSLVVVVEGGCNVAPRSVGQVMAVTGGQPVGVRVAGVVPASCSIGQGISFGGRQFVQKVVVVVIVHFEQSHVAAPVDRRVRVPYPQGVVPAVAFGGPYPA